MGNAESVVATLANHEAQLAQHDQMAVAGGNAEAVVNQIATGQPATVKPAGPTISPTPKASDVPTFGFDWQPPEERMTMPLAKVLMAAHDKLREVENFTEEGKQEHPIQAKMGEIANNIEGFLFGNKEHRESSIGTGETGILTNPVTGSLIPGPEGKPAAFEALEGGANLVKSGVQAAKEAIYGGKASESGPSLVKQVIKGKEVAQGPAKAALTSAAETTGESATPNLRAMMDKPIAQSAKAERAAYDAVNKAAGTDLKDLYDYRSRLQDAIDNPANIDREDLLQEKLGDVESRIKHAESTATRNLVNAPQKLDEAKGLTQQRYAQEELKKRLFNNEGVVSGNVQHGVEEQINVDAAIREVEKLDKPSRFAPEGSPTRLQQALGKDGASKLKQGLYAAQKSGQSAVSKQKVALWIGGLIGAGAITGAARHAAATIP